MYSWKEACNDAYEPIKYHKGWKKCKVCNEIPRLWIFDNGSYANCRCYYRWSETPVQVESILSYVKRNNGYLGDFVKSEERLRLAWNEFVKTGEFQNKLLEGRW